MLRPDGRAIGDDARPAGKAVLRPDRAVAALRADPRDQRRDARSSAGAPYQSDHEDANGQFEMNWTYDDALVTADRHVFFKFMVKELAGQHGLRATFMPKPFMHLTGNGCHAHVSLWDRAGDDQPVSRSRRRARPLGPRLPFSRRHPRPRRGVDRAVHADRQQLQADQRGADRVGRHLVAERDQLRRQQPHPYGAHPRAGSFRIAADGRRRQPLSAAGRACLPAVSTA